MGKYAIRVQNLGKQYTIGAYQGRYKSLRDSLTHAVTAPFRRFGKNGAQEQAERTIWALKDVSFEIEQGEVVGIIGRNGAGKSTLLKILARITEPTTGEMRMRGRVGSLLEVGTGFHPELTGRENIFLNGAILGMSRKEIGRKFDEIVDFAEIEKFIDTPAKHYSSGMYMRLAFAVAAHLEPEILLVDEVLAVGDAQFQEKCTNKMGVVAKQGRTVLFVSHNMAAILNLCKNTYLFKSGEIESYGFSHEVVTRYLALENNYSASHLFHLKDTEKDFSFLSVAISNPGSESRSDLSLVEGVEVRITYQILEPVRGMSVAFHLYNSLGYCVFSSTDVDGDYLDLNKTRSPGVYQTTCFIPPLFLKAERYSLGLSASIPNYRVLGDFPNVVSFSMIDTGSIESKLGQGRQGVISPLLNWKTTQVLEKK